MPSGAVRLPRNCPDWARRPIGTINRRGNAKDWHTVDVSVRSGFTVVTLNHHHLTRKGNTKSCQIRVFATRDGRRDHTGDYRRMTFGQFRQSELATYTENGLSRSEAFRLFEYGRIKKRKIWMKHYLEVLYRYKEFLRTEDGSRCLRDIAKADNFLSQRRSIYAWGVSVFESFRFDQAGLVAVLCLWVFHGVKLKVK